MNLKNISMVFDTVDGEVRAVDAIDLSMNAGQFTVIQGASGCGKTTLMLVAGALMKPTSGSVQVAGIDPYSLSAERRAEFRAAHIGFVFQQFHLIPYLSVLENVLAATLAVPDQSAEERARVLLGELQMESRLQHVPAKLSTGEQQRTALARSMINHPTMIFADEPTGNLDPKNGEIVLRTLKRFTESGGMVLMVTHDRHAASYGDVVKRMDRGKFI